MVRCISRILSLNHGISGEIQLVNVEYAQQLLLGESLGNGR